MADPDILKTTDDLLTAWQQAPANLLQILIQLQQRFSHIPKAAIGHLSSRLDLPLAHIEGVIDFYSFLHHHPRGQFDILLSDNITDRMQGNHELMAQLATSLSCPPGTTRSDNRVSLGFTSCTGMSDQGPAALVNGRAIPQLDHMRIGQIAELVEAGQPLEQWPTAFFQVEDHIQRKDLLLETPLAPGSVLKILAKKDAESLLEEIEASGLRGRGGAGFPTGRKWRFCREAGGDPVVVCNADEGEPGTFKDRVLLHSYLGHLIEGMSLCAGILGAKTGFIYLRGEYLYLLEGIEASLEQARQEQRLGSHFDIQVHLGAGAYVCGEESALIESLEGKRGNPRIRPPFPVTSGYLGRPTVVNNVETFIAAALIAQQGADWFRSRGTEESTGTKLISVSGDCTRPGIYEFPWGTSIRTILEACGAESTQAVQVAGAAGYLLPPSQFHRTLAYEDLGTGGSFMIFNQERDLLEVVGNFADFFVHESCGFCTPCRVGTSLLQKRLNKLRVKHATGIDLDTLGKISMLMRQTSHCGLGATASNPVLDLLLHFPNLVEQHLRHSQFEPAFDLDGAVEEARRITGRNDAGAHISGSGV